MPQLNGLERYSVEELLREMTDNSADMNWPKKVSQPIDEFNTEGLEGMCFPEIFKMKSATQQLLSKKSMLNW